MTTSTSDDTGGIDWDSMAEKRLGQRPPGPVQGHDLSFCTDLEISDEWEKRFGVTLDPEKCVLAALGTAGAVEANPLAGLVASFSSALLEKLKASEEKYRWGNGWLESGWSESCLKQFHEHIVKGDPLDVAAYCAFMWQHGWSTAAPSPAALDPVTVKRCAQEAETWQGLKGSKLAEKIRALASPVSSTVPTSAFDPADVSELVDVAEAHFLPIVDGLRKALKEIEQLGAMYNVDGNIAVRMGNIAHAALIKAGPVSQTSRGQS